MRTLFVIGLLLVCAFMAGWFTVHRDEEGTTIRINRDEIRGDARQALDRGREILDRNGDRVQQPAEQVARQPGQADYQPHTDPRLNQPYDPRTSQY